MLQTLDSEICECYRHAAECSRSARASRHSVTALSGNIGTSRSCPCNLWRVPWKTHRHFLGNPSVGFLEMLLIGAIAGWIAEKITQSNHSIFTNILVGIAGAFVVGVLASILNIPVFGFFRTLVAATIGAVLILFVWHRAPRRA